MCEVLRRRVSIRIELVDEEAQNFLSIKKGRGLKNNSEVIRLLIAEEARRLEGA